eukprot:m.159129 g.159129  ORF g.159129 m.159129 type:complete len:152 (+) comp16346_c0_seq2:3147-3602(+)
MIAANCVARTVFAPFHIICAKAKAARGALITEEACDTSFAYAFASLLCALLTQCASLIACTCNARILQVGAVAKVIRRTSFAEKATLKEKLFVVAPESTKKKIHQTLGKLGTCHLYRSTMYKQLSICRHCSWLNYLVEGYFRENPTGMVGC